MLVLPMVVLLLPLVEVLFDSFLPNEFPNPESPNPFSPFEVEPNPEELFVMLSVDEENPPVPKPSAPPKFELFSEVEPNEFPKVEFPKPPPLSVELPKPPEKPLFELEPKNFLIQVDPDSRSVY
uniref:Uncharacterized protein n=1 Tax=Acrobeloides nanus TaxID=290746 RepID=A0A914EJC7_9BILA